MFRLKFIIKTVLFSKNALRDRPERTSQGKEWHAGEAVSKCDLRPQYPPVARLISRRYRLRAEGPTAVSPGQRPGYDTFLSAMRPERAKALVIKYFSTVPMRFCPFRATVVVCVIPRALPWAVGSLGLQPAA